MTLNEPLVMEAARALARRVLAEGGRERRGAGRLRLPPLREPPADRGRAGGPAGAPGEAAPAFADGWANPWELATGKAGRPDDLPPGTTPTQLAA